MKKIVYLSLDERPCNYDFPYDLFDDEKFKINRVSLNYMGFKKKPADTNKISEWLLDETKDAYGLVLSIDTLIYGGIVPSRLHHFSIDELKDRLNFIRTIKEHNPNLIIYGFQLIMRCPGYNSDEEEPAYYANYGKDIHRYGYINHLIELNKATPDQVRELENINIPSQFLDDFSKRRDINKVINTETLKLVDENIIDFLVIPQDDSSEYGWTAKDQEYIHDEIINKNLMTKVYMYPGADEVGMTLMARLYNKANKLRPKLYIKYPSISSGMIIPNIEDRYLDTMVKYHVIVSGGLVASSLAEADAVLFINAPADRMLSRFSSEKPGRGLIQLRNMPEAIEFIEYAYKELDKPIIVGDITHGNGTTLEMYNYLQLKDMLFDVAGYGGWNTASNSIGSAVAQGMAFINKGRTKELMNFLVSRYVDDIAYQGHVRQIITKEILPNQNEFTYYDVKEERGDFVKIVESELKKFMKINMKELYENTTIKDVSMPWKRMYEINLIVEYEGKLR